MTDKQIAIRLLKLAKGIVSADTFKCPKCGTKVLKNTGYCIKCKKKVKKSKVSAKTFKCPTCGTKVLEQTGFCVKCKKKVKKSSIARNARVFFAADPMNQALNAYSDVHDEEGYGPRDLSYKGAFSDARWFGEIIKKAIPQGYNYFDPDKVGKTAVANGRYKYALGREGSVAVYIKGVKNVADVADLVKDFMKARADEVSLEKGGKTLWAEWAHKMSDLINMDESDINGAEVRVWWD
jgi:DNA-directed RNA polymerase subunit RPC12/RpoP